MRSEKDLQILAPLLQEIPFFKQRNIEGSSLQDISSELAFEQCQAGEFVFKQGDYGDRFYIILHGKVQVLINNPNLKKGQAKKKKKINPIYKQLKTIRKKKRDQHSEDGEGSVNEG